MSYEQLHSTIYAGTPEEMKCIGYKDSSVKKFFFVVLTVVTLGLIKLVMYWKPIWEVKLTKTQCALKVCNTVVLINEHNDYFTEQVLSLNSESPSLKYFEHKCIRFFWDGNSASFIAQSGFEPKCSELLKIYQGISEKEKALRKQIYGPNVIKHNVRSYPKLLIDEVLHPFYVFQIFSIILWSFDSYYYYASCIFLVSCISVAISLYETKKQDVTLHDMISSQAVSTIMVSKKENDYEEILTSELVPGDVIIIPEQGCSMSCDAVLMTGNCIVNESMLTGESVPVTKTPLTAQSETEIYSPKIHRSHTLFCGTEILQTRYYGQNRVTAIVVRTGFLTAKGELIRSIMFPRPITLYRDAMHFILVLFGIAVIGMAFSVYLYLERGSSVKEIFLRALDIITIVVPPSLPAALTIGTVYAQQRLKKEGIFCISPQRINESGKIKTICFDKTGTLTEDNLDLHAVIPVENENFANIVLDPSTLPATNTLIAAMASCHSLTLIGKRLTGDPLDIKMFEATKWELEEPGEDSSRFDLLVPTVVRPPVKFSYQLSLPTLRGSQSSQIEDHMESSENRNFFGVDSQIPFEIGIVRQFTFSSSLQRMSVVVRQLGSDHMDIYVKGAPEKVSSLCLQETVPDDFQSVLHKYSVQGFRVLALAHKPVSSKVTWHHVQRIKRNVIESNLTFLGLLLMQNSLKPETKSVIDVLHKANLRTVMVTGDNMLTAVSVARECKMISPNDNIIFVKAHPAQNGHPSVIEYEKITHDQDSTIQSPMNESPYSLLLNIEKHNNFNFALDGKAYGILRSEFSSSYQKILVKGKVFARMAPDQKTQLIEDLQKLNYIVGMCGDGANDCGALKAAHVGISLSEAEASVAAPFTSKTQNITCVSKVIKEGRCALVTSFGVFKFMALYSMIQFISVLILYTRGSILSDMMFLYIDLIIITTVAVLMSLTGPYKKLAPKRPLSNLINVKTMFSVFAHILVSVCGQLACLYFLQYQNWFFMKKVLKTDRVVTWETTVIFCISSFQYIIVAFVFSKGPPYRQPIYKNMKFLMALVLLVAFSTFLLFEPVHQLNKFFQMKGNGSQHMIFKLHILLIVSANFILAALVEAAIYTNSFKRFARFIKCRKGPKNLYKCLNLEIDTNPNWPPFNEISYSPSIS